MPDEGGDERGGGLPDGADEEGAAAAPALDEDEGGDGAGDGDAGGQKKRVLSGSNLFAIRIITMFDVMVENCQDAP